TMRLAQQLYEGQDIGEGSVGLITYMRTDSVSLAAEAVHEIREVAARLYGAAEVAEEPRVYKTKSKNAQEAHEAIRPTSAAITPADVEGKIEEDLYRLYSLIWKRAVASQMSHALFEDRKSTRLNSSHLVISYAVYCLKKKNTDCPLLVGLNHADRHRWQIGARKPRYLELCGDRGDTRGMRVGFSQNSSVLAVPVFASG